jgi:hypothetical protein
MTKQKDDTVNSHDTKSNPASGASISLLKKIAAIFQPKRGAVLRRIYAGLNSDFASSKKQKTQIQGMFTPHGISDLKLSPGEITTLIDSPLTSKKDRKDLVTYMKHLGIANDIEVTFEVGSLPESKLKEMVIPIIYERKQ